MKPDHPWKRVNDWRGLNGNAKKAIRQLAKWRDKHPDAVRRGSKYSVIRSTVNET